MDTVITNNSNIRGINVGETEINVCQLADDTLLFLKDPNSVKVALSCFEEFYRYAGLKLNKTETEAIILYNDGGIQIDKSLNN